MKERTHKLRKSAWIAIILFTLLILLPAIAGYYFVTYRLKSSIQYAVTKGTNGRYAFDAQNIHLSLWNKTFLLENARLVCLDTNDVNAYYTVKVQDIFFSVSSLSDLLLNKKWLIDSLSITDPDFMVQVRTKKVIEKKAGAFHTSNILELLQTTLKKVNARSLTIKNAAFTYGVLNGPPPFHADHIDIALYNFSKVTGSDEHILGSDNVTLSLGTQNWIIPDGQHKIAFRGLRFEGKAQRFELDSCTIYRQDPERRGDMILYADKFYFNSRHLPAIYMRNELLIDSLICVNPVISLPEKEKKIEKTKDTLNKVNYIFDKVNIGYIEVKNGDIAVNSRKNRSRQLATHTANLNIYNLNLDPAAIHPFSTDSIKFNLKHLSFLSKDSLYKLSIEAFSFKGNNALFSHVVYEPVSAAVAKSIRFTAPALLVKDISMEELLRGRIMASQAELLHPVITVINKTDAVQTEKIAAKPTLQKLDMFYQSLHDMSELINVETFTLANGSASFTVTSKKPVKLSVTKINSRLLLNKLFRSDSLVDIKHAIPELRFGTVHITTPKMTIAVTNYHFDGTQRLNWGNSISVSLPGGNTLEGKKIYWEVFDWDVFQQTGDLQIQLLRLGELRVVATGNKNTAVGNTKKSVRQLPVIRIGKFEAGKIYFSVGGTTPVNFLATDLYANNIQTKDKFFTWDSSRATLSHIMIQSEKMKAEAGEINFNNYATSNLKDIRIASTDGKNTKNILVPLISIQANPHSTDFAKLAVASVVINQPEIKIITDKAASTPQVDSPAKNQRRLAAGIAYIKINGAKLNYTLLNEKDTVKSIGNAEATISGLRFSRDTASVVNADALSLMVNNIIVDKKNITATLPSALLSLKNVIAWQRPGKKTDLTAAVAFNWSQAAIHYQKDSTRIDIEKLSGNYREKFTAFNPKQKMAWQSLINQTSILEGNLSYQGKSSAIALENYTWNPLQQELSLRKFSVTPVLNRDITFKNIPWQTDYITIKGDLLKLDGVHLAQTKNDSMLHIRSIVLNNIDLHASRDKRLPFHHGIEKQMPTKLIGSIKTPLVVDTVLLGNTDVTYHEFSVATGQWSDVFLKNISGYLLNVTNRHQKDDSLQLSVSADIFDNHIKKFSYSESYSDSLSGFTALSRLSPFQLTKFSRLSMPMAGVSVTSGETDTSFAVWRGNKYAAFGTMNFFYRDLKIKIHNKKDTSTMGFLPSLKTMVANWILPDKRGKPSAIFVERDTEKFIFNYWVKAQSKGLLSAVGIKRNKKYRKQYILNQKKYLLPLKTDKELKKSAINGLPVG